MADYYIVTRDGGVIGGPYPTRGVAKKHAGGRGQILTYAQVVARKKKGTLMKRNAGRGSKKNTGVAGWRAKGFRAGVGGRHGDMYSAWNAQTGKPAKSAPLGKQVDAKESFFEGYLRGLERREQKQRTNAGKTIRRLKKDLRAAGHSDKLRRQVVKTAKGYARSRRLVAAEDRAKKNPPKMKKVTGSSGWLKADAVRFVKKRGRIEVFIKRAKPRGRKR